MKEKQAIEALIDTAIAEDIRSGDAAAELCVPPFAKISGKIFLKQSGVIAGLPILSLLFEKIDPTITFTPLVQEGTYKKTGSEIAKISGPAQTVLGGERLALNFLQHASGVATQTAAYVKKVAGTSCNILDTRRTLPGLRALEKYAIRMGGGVNHRFGLGDRIVIKTSHLLFLAAETDKPISEAVERAKKAHPKHPVEVEIVDQKQLEEALSTNVDTIVLHHMTPELIATSVKKSKKRKKRVLLECPHALTIDTVRSYAETGVDGILIGSLTYSVEGLDMGMRLSF